MIAEAQRRHIGIDFRQAEVTALPFADGSFDSVICNFALGHFPLPEAALTECVRVLTAGGTLAMTWWDQPSRQRIQGLFREAIAELGLPPAPAAPTGHDMLRFSDAAAFEALLYGAGLDGVRVSPHRTTFLLPDAEVLWQAGMGGMAMTASAVAAKDVATQARVREHIARQAEAYRTPEGLAIPIAFLLGAGCKL
jgi:SAM-dependent methyltransferase